MNNNKRLPACYVSTTSDHASTYLQEKYKRIYIQRNGREGKKKRSATKHGSLSIAEMSIQEVNDGRVNYCVYGFKPQT